MCEYCEDGRWKNIRVALAAEAIGKFSVQAKADSMEGIEPFVEAAVAKFKDMICSTSGISPCPPTNSRRGCEEGMAEAHGRREIQNGSRG